MSEYTTYIEIEVKVHYDFEAGEPTVLYPNDKAHPGSDDSITINAVMVSDYDLIEQISEDHAERIQDEIMESLQENEQ